MSETSFKRLAWTIVKVVITLTCFYLVARKMDLSALGEDFRHMKWYWTCAALAQFALVPLLGGARWRVVLRALGSGISEFLAIRMFWIAMAFSQVLPSSAGGDAVRILMTRRSGESWQLAAHSVILERVAMVASLVAIVTLCAPVASSGHADAELEAVIALLAVATAGGIAVLLVADHITSRFLPWRALKFVASLSQDARKAFRGPSGARLMSLSILTHLNMAVACLWLGHSLELPLSPIQYLLYISLITLISTLPLSIGGWGIREGAVVTLFGGLGVAAHNALAFSISLGACVALVSATGILGMWLGGSRSEPALEPSSRTQC